MSETLLASPMPAASAVPATPASAQVASASTDAPAAPPFDEQLLSALLGGARRGFMRALERSEPRPPSGEPERAAVADADGEVPLDPEAEAMADRDAEADPLDLRATRSPGPDPAARASLVPAAAPEGASDAAVIAGPAAEESDETAEAGHARSATSSPTSSTRGALESLDLPRLEQATLEISSGEAARIASAPPGRPDVRAEARADRSPRTSLASTSAAPRAEHERPAPPDPAAPLDPTPEGEPASGRSAPSLRPLHLVQLDGERRPQSAHPGPDAQPTDRETAPRELAPPSLAPDPRPVASPPAEPGSPIGRAPLEGMAAALPPVEARAPSAEAGSVQRALPELPPRTEQAIVREIEILARAGGGRARLVLEPPALGGLGLRLELRHKVLRLEMVADRLPVADLLARHAPELRAALSAQGLSIERLDVDLRSDSDTNTSTRDPEGRGSGSPARRGPQTATPVPRWLARAPDSLGAVELYV